MEVKMDIIAGTHGAELHLFQWMHNSFVVQLHSQKSNLLLLICHHFIIRSNYRVPSSIFWSLACTGCLPHAFCQRWYTFDGSLNVFVLFCEMFDVCVRWSQALNPQRDKKWVKSLFYQDWEHRQHSYANASVHTSLTTGRTFKYNSCTCMSM